MNHDAGRGNASQSADPSVEQEGFSPLRFLLSTIGAVFLAEVIAMIVLLSFKTLPYYVLTLIDAGIMIVLVSPVIYLLSFRPLLQHIEKRRQAELQVREMALFPALNPDTVLQVDASGQIMKANPAGTKMGLVAGAQLFNLIPDLCDLDLPGCIAEGKTQQVQQTQLGERVLQWVIHGAPALGLAFLYSTDVTEQKRAEAEIYRLSSIVQQTTDTVVVTNREGVIEYVNPAFERQTGYSKEEVLGQTPRVLKSGVHDELFYRELWGTILTGESYQNEVTNRSKSGLLFHEVKTITPLRDAKGNITHFVATGKDITERKEAEEKLKHAYDELELRVQQRTGELSAANTALLEEINERKRILSALEQSERELRVSEEKAQNLVQYAPAAIYEMDLSGQRFLNVNDIACQWTGYTREEMLCMNPLDLVDEGSRTRFQERIEAKLGGEDIDESLEYRLLAKDGHAIIAEMHVRAFTYKDGKPESVLVVAHNITRRKKAEEALRQSREDLRRAQEVGQIGSWRLDVRYDVLTWSEENYRIFGIPVGTPLTYETFLGIVHPDDRDYVDTQWQAGLAGAPYDIEHRIVADGQVKWVREKAYLEFDEAGKLLGGFGITQDISDRKRAEEQLRYQATLLSNVNDAIMASDAEYHITAWNTAAESLYGWKAEEVVGRNGVEMVQTEWSEKNADEMRRIIAETGRWRGEATQVRKDGKRFPVEVSSMALYDDHGQVAGYVSVNRDITERKQAEIALRLAHDELEQRVQERTAELAIANRELQNEIAERQEIERQLRIQTAAMEAAANGIVITDPQGNILWTNPALTQMSGYGVEELLGQSTRIFNSGEHERDYYRNMWSTILAGNVWKGETINRRKDGSHYIEGQTITPVQGEDGKISHFIAIKEDISDKKQAEQDLRARTEKERILTQTIHALQLDIARDLHDTLGQNISFLRMKLAFLSGRKIRKQADLQMEIRNMARVADESYDLMRGTLAILQSTDSSDLHRLFTRYTAQIEERSGFKVDFSSQGESKPIPAPRMRQLFYIFREILSNIEKHALASQVNIEMLWGADHLKLMVSDNGQGFDVNEAQFGGHYGLKFMRERVEVLNGSLTLRSDPESGTNVAVLIPYETS